MTELRDRLQAALGSSYTVEQELGGGAMSRVFVAREEALGRPVVVKVLPPEMAPAVNAERFRREIQVAASLQHPHIVSVLSAGAAEGLLYYTMPFVEGESLRHRLAREGALPIAECVRLLRDIADALACAHARGVVHRDIKPANILLSGNHALVADFGVAKAVSAASDDATLTSAGLALGTPAYMSPEQALAEPTVDHRADLYALGVVAYEMLGGRPPFAGMTARQLLIAQATRTPESLTTLRADVPPGIEALVMRCLAKDPDDRVQTAEELLAELEFVAHHARGAGPPRGPRAADMARRSPAPHHVSACCLGTGRRRRERWRSEFWPSSR
ncbi:MAG: serine/threonine-protein kinase [Gemmatimonadaceae bacterium]